MSYAEEVFDNEYDTYWLTAGGRDEAEAKRLIATLGDYTLDMLEVTRVHGRVTMKDGAPWFDEVPRPLGQEDVGGWWRIEVLDE